MRYLTLAEVRDRGRDGIGRPLMRIDAMLLCSLVLLIGCGRTKERPTTSRNASPTAASREQGSPEVEVDEPVDEIKRVPDEITMPSILDALRRRQRAVRSLRFVWREQRTRCKDSAARPGMPVVDDDFTYEAHVDLSIDESKLRCTTDGGLQWSDNPPHFQTRGYDHAFNGTVAKTFWEPGVSYPAGYIETRKSRSALADFLPVYSSPEFSNYNLLPIFLSFRPLQSDMGRIKPGEYVVAEQRAEIDGHACILIRSATRSLWLDPQCGFAPLRYRTAHANGSPRLQIDISYVNDAANGWSPSAWEIVELRADGSLHESVSATVTSKVINGTFGPDHFELQFPVGTVVTDVGAGIDYIVRTGQRKRVITRAEAGATYEEWLATESGKAVPHGPTEQP